MRIAVTGAAGFIGSHLTERLVKTGAHEIIAVDNLRTGTLNNLKTVLGDIRFVPADICDRSALDYAFRGCEVVYHLAAVPRVLECEAKPDECFSVNVAGTNNVLAAARLQNVRRIVFTSSREVYGEPDTVPVDESATLAPGNHYGASKAAGEMFLSHYASVGMEVVILRLSNVYGPKDRDRVIPRFAELALNGSTLSVYGGDQIIDFISVDRVVHALSQTGFGPCIPQPLNVASGVGVCILNVAKRILALTNSHSSLKIVQKRECEVRRFVADATRANELFSWPSIVDPLADLPQVCQWIARNLTTGAMGGNMYAAAEDRQ